MRIEVKGVDKVIKKLDRVKSLDGVKRSITEYGPDVESTMKKNENFVRGYSTGLTEERTTHTIRKDGLELEVGTDTPYAHFVEDGTRFMDPEPFALPTYYEVKDEFVEKVIEGLKKDD